MNNEIKEILSFKEDADYKRLSIEDILLLKEYIINLKKENTRLKEIVENLTTMTVCGDGKQIKQTAQYKLDIAQQRIDKAIEYIENNTLYSEDFDYDDEDNLQFQGAYDYKAREDLLEILKGSEKG